MREERNIVLKQDAFGSVVLSNNKTTEIEQKSACQQQLDIFGSNTPWMMGKAFCFQLFLSSFERQQSLSFQFQLKTFISCVVVQKPELRESEGRRGRESTEGESWVMKSGVGETERGNRQQSKS